MYKKFICSMNELINKSYILRWVEEWKDELIIFKDYFMSKNINKTKKYHLSDYKRAFSNKSEQTNERDNIIPTFRKITIFLKEYIDK